MEFIVGICLFALMNLAMLAVIKLGESNPGRRG